MFQRGYGVPQESRKSRFGPEVQPEKKNVSRHFFENALKNFPEGFFGEIFFKPQVLIEIRRLRMFLMIFGHLRHTIPPLEHRGSPKSQSKTEFSKELGLSTDSFENPVLDRDCMAHNVPEGVWDASGGQKSSETCAINVSR